MAGVHARFDRHARGVCVRGSGEQAAVFGFAVAALRHVVADLVDGRGGLVCGQVVYAQEVGVAVDLGRVAGAGFRAAGFADGGVVLEAGAAVAFLAVFEAGEVEVFAAAVGLAGFDGHARGICVRGAGEGAGVNGIISATHVGPAG